MGKETVTVPAGTFETWKVKWIWPRYDTFAWFSMDAHRYPVKVQYVGGDPFELVEARKGSNAGTVALDTQEADVSMKLPAGWFSYGMGPLERRVIAPEMVAIGGVRRMPMDEDPAFRTARELTDHLVETRRDEGHVARSGPDDFDLHGLSATRLVSDYGDGMVKYSVAVVREGERIRVWFDVKKQRWDELKPVFDEMIASLSVEAR
jgi:hypothetical protein